MIRRLPRIPLVFAGGKWQGVTPYELEFGDLCYVARCGHNACDREIARQEIYRRFGRRNRRRLDDRNDPRKNGRV